MVDLPTGLVIDRAAFDAALVEAAILAGADFAAETTAIVAAEGDDLRRYRRVQSRLRVAPTVSVYLRVVLAADGLGHASVRHIQLFTVTRQHARV